VDHKTGKWTHRTYARQLRTLSPSDLFAIGPERPVELTAEIDRPTLDTTVQKLEKYIANAHLTVPLLNLLKDDIPIARFDRFRSFATPLEGALVRAAVKLGVDGGEQDRIMAEKNAWVRFDATVEA